MTSFDEILTRELEWKIRSKVQQDFNELIEAYRKFIHKYSMNGTVADFEKIEEYTLKSLPKRNFEMFPELEEYLFKQKSQKLIDSLIKVGEAEK